MSTVYDKTDNYSLNLYGDNDPADLRDGYNGSMRTIDTAMGQHLNRIETVEAHETHDEEVVKTLLGDNTVGAANTAKTSWNGKQDARTECVFIGDSITAGYGLENPTVDRYPVFVAKGLHETPHVYAQDGAGFVAVSTIPPYNTLTSLANQAIADNSYDHGKVGHVFLMGGINDGLNLADQAADNAKSILKKLKDSYPYAMIVFGICPTCGKSRQNDKKTVSGMGAIVNNVTKLHEIQSTDEGASVVFIDCWKMLWANGDATTDGLHPNKVGHRFFASQILSTMTGTTYDNVMQLPSSSFTVFNSPTQYPDKYADAKKSVTSITAPEDAVRCFSFDGNHLGFEQSRTLTLSMNIPSDASNDIEIPLFRLPQFMESYQGSANFSQIISMGQMEKSVTNGKIFYIYRYNRATNIVSVFIARTSQSELVNTPFVVAMAIGPQIVRLL